MTDFTHITYGVEKGLARLTINRAPFNVLDIATMEEMNLALDEAKAATDIKLLVITGAGEKAFSAGVEVADHTPDKVERMIEVFHGIFRRLQQLPIPTLAAVNGAALGGGMEVAIACDLVVAAAGAKFGQPEIKLAVFPPVAAVLLPRLVSPARAMELLLGGENLLAEEALRIGLVNRVFARESFAADLAAYVAPYLSLSRAALASTLKAIRAASGKPFGEALEAAERIYLKELMATEDAKEGLNAFIEKRKPVWKNR